MQIEERGYRYAWAITPSNTDQVAGGLAFVAVVTTAGNAHVLLDGGDEITLPLDEGLNILPFNVVQIFEDSTAVGTFYNVS